MIFDNPDSPTPTDNPAEQPDLPPPPAEVPTPLPPIEQLFPLKSNDDYKDEAYAIIDTARSQGCPPLLIHRVVKFLNTIHQEHLGTLRARNREHELRQKNP